MKLSIDIIIISRSSSIIIIIIIIILGVKLLKDSIMDRLSPSKVVRRAITDRLAVLIITSQLLPLHWLRNYLI